MTTSVRSEATRSIVAVNGVDRLAINSDGSMELLTPASNPSGNKVPTASQLLFTKEYVSPEQTITLGATTNLNHGLSAVPKLVQLSLICKTAELGCTVGEEFTTAHDGNANSYGAVAYRSSTNIRLVVGATGLYLINAAGALVVLTPANWRLIVRAWA